MCSRTVLRCSPDAETSALRLTALRSARSVSSRVAREEDNARPEAGGTGSGPRLVFSTELSVLK